MFTILLYHYCQLPSYPVGILHSGHSGLHSTRGVQAVRLYCPMWLLVTGCYHVWDVDGSVLATVTLTAQCMALHAYRLPSILCWRAKRDLPQNYELEEVSHLFARAPTHLTTSWTAHTQVRSIAVYPIDHVIRCVVSVVSCVTQQSVSVRRLKILNFIHSSEALIGIT